jgi:haloacetate dehalogenase
LLSSFWDDAASDPPEPADAGGGLAAWPWQAGGVFEGFRTVDVEVEHGSGGVRVHAVVGGHGPAVLLLHGFPQSHVMWHELAPRLAASHTVVAADLRGYGESGIPAEPPADVGGHAAYSFRAMAADQVALMAHLGHERFAVVGHDRGARVAHRMALDHPSAVRRAAVLDILPTTHMYASMNQRLATAYYHWFFFIQPEPVPERLIAGDPIGYLHSLLGAWGGNPDYLAPQALAAYERAFADPARRHAMLEDYRAGASLDLVHDQADAAAGHLVDAPLLALWGSRSTVGTGPDDVVEIWRQRASNVTGQAIDAGHFLAEEQPEHVLAALQPFLSGPE